MEIVGLKYDYLLLDRFIMSVVRGPDEMGTSSSKALAKQSGRKRPTA